jgi:CheY-like chemotaxis protein
MKNTRFILVDDSHIDLLIIERMLRQLYPEFSVLSFDDSTKGLRYLQELKASEMDPHVVMLDIQMPILDGFAFLDAYDRIDDSVKAKTKVLMMSSSTNNADISRAKSNKNVRAYLSKPITKQAISDAIEIVGNM